MPIRQCITKIRYFCSISKILKMYLGNILRIIGFLTTIIIRKERSIVFPHFVSADVLSKTICIAIAGGLAILPVSATDETDSLKIVSVSGDGSSPESISSDSCISNAVSGKKRHVLNDSLIIKYPYSRLIECTHIGVPLIVGGIIEMEHNKKFRELRNSFIPKFHNEIDYFTQYLPAGVMFGMKAFGVPSRSKNWGEMLTADAFSAIIMAGFVNSIKYTAKLRRPDGSSNNSFPSGHTATAFMTAHMLNVEYGHLSPWIGMGAYATASATGLMRMANNRHWMSDILAGAGIGILSTEFGYWLSDIIFNRDKVKTEIIDHWLNYEPSDPSFLGFYASFQIPLTKYKPTSGPAFNTSTGSSAGLEGAWYWNNYLGVGGRLSVSSVYYSYDAGNNGDTFDMSMLQAGIYSNINVFKHMYISPKVLAGVNYYNSISNEYFSCPTKLGACLNTGISVGAMVCSYFDVNFFGGWNVLSPHNQNQDQVIQTIELGARFAYRFAHEE